MSTFIIYNNQQIPSPTPFVELNRDLVFVGDKWENVDKIKLNGQLTGNFNQLTGAQQNLINIFNKNFKTFDIYEATGSYTLVLSGSSFGNLNLTGELPFNTKSLILQIDGCYSSTTPATWEISNDLINWSPFYLYKIKYYTKGCCGCGPSPIRPDGTIFSQSNLLNQPLPYTGTTGVAHLSDFTSDLSKNALGVYSGEYTYSSGKYIRLRGTYLGGSIIAMKLEASGNSVNNIYSRSGIIIDSISFDNSVYNGILNYNIELRSKDSKYNIENPVNEFSFSEDENKVLNLNHRISAQGVNTSSSSISNALDNAINFVRSFSGLNNLPTTRFINTRNNNYYLKDIKESFNRLNGTYTIEEVYTNDLSSFGASGGLLRYTVDVNSGAQSNVIEIKIQGDFTGPTFGQISGLRPNLNVTALLSGAYSGYFNPIPLSYNITENSGENKISFDYSFDNVPLPNPYFDYKIDVSKDELSQITNININAEIIARGNRQNRYALSLANLNTFTGNFLSIAQSGLTQFNYLNDILNIYNLRLIDIQVDQNPNDGKISASAKYDDKSMPPSGFSDGAFSISVNAPYWYMKANPTSNVKGFYVIQDFDILTLPKQSISLDLTATNDSNITEAQFENTTKNLAKKVASNDYLFNFDSQEQTNITKKYNKSESLYKISYNLEKIATQNNNQILPKFK